MSYVFIKFLSGVQDPVSPLLDLASCDPEVVTQLDASQQTKVNEVSGLSAGFIHLDVWLPGMQRGRIDF